LRLSGNGDNIRADKPKLNCPNDSNLSFNFNDRQAPETGSARQVVAAKAISSEPDYKYAIPLRQATCP